MKQFLAVCALGALVAAAAAGACGKERWAVKTLTDPAAKLIDWKPRPATIAQLSAVPGGDFHGRQPFEQLVYRVTAKLTSYKIEADGDVHAVLEQRSGDSMIQMIVELPAVSCTVGAQHRYRIALARRAFDARWHPTTHWKRADVRVTVTGVGFLDFKHGQRGVAANGVELHPVTALRFV